MDLPVPKSQQGVDRIASGEELVGASDGGDCAEVGAYGVSAAGSVAGRGVDMVAVALRIVGRRLPGSSWSGRSGIHVGLQRDDRVVNLVNGDEGEAVFDVDLDVIAGADGQPDFRGDFVHGRRGERFVYLSWGEVDDTGTFTMFRRLKLHLMPLVEQCSPEGVLAAKRIQAVLELTDTKGRPLAASVRPPWVTWRLLNR
jgi:hypothetical protein